MATIDSLANETLIHIMKMLKAPSPRLWHNEYAPIEGRYDALQAAALVCSRWRDPAQRALFDEVFIRLQHPLRASRFLASAAQPHHQTTSLCVATAADDWLQVAEAGRGLQSVETFWPGHISITVLSKPCFAELRHLMAVGTDRSLIEDALEPGASPSTGLSSLSSLALWTPLDDQRAVAFLAAAAKSSLGNLNTLRTRIPRSNPEMQLSIALGVVGPLLRTFTLDSAYSGLDRNLDVFSVLKSVESFFWNGSFPSSPLRTNDVQHLRSILDAFPSPATLRHLSIGTVEFASLEYVTPLLGHSALTLLAKLKFPCLPPCLPSSTPLSWPAEVAAMTKACEDRGIQWSMGGVVMPS